MQAFRLCLFACLLGAAFASPAVASEADFDTSFSGDGKLTVSFDIGAPNLDELAAIFDGTDNGGVWVIGSAAGPDFPQRLPAIARLSPSGAFLFKRTLPISVNAVVAAAPAPFGGAVIVADVPVSGGSAALVIKLDAQGNLDPQFAGDGTLQVGVDDVIDLAVEPAGSIDILYGNPSTFNGGRRFLTRISSPGTNISNATLDTVDTFSTGALAVQRDGKLLVALPRDIAAPCSIQIIRYLPGSQSFALTIDPTFSTQSYPLEAGACSAYPRDMRVDNQGRIAVAVRTLSSFQVLGFQPSGLPNTAFGASGRLFVSDTSIVPYTIAFQPEGTLLLGGELNVGVGTERRFAVCRLLQSGSPDVTFNGGTFCRNFAFAGTGGVDSTFNRATDMAFLASGRIIVGGTMLWATPNDDDFAIARLNGSGRQFLDGFE